MLDLKWRGKAAGIHLAGSGFVACLAAALVFLLWYPGAYRYMAGGAGLFTLLVSVDVVIGPLITFAVFDRRKPRAELQRDLAIVVVLQLAALGYGLHVMHAVRPVVLALENSRFRVVRANDVLNEELPSAEPAFRSLPLSGPIIVRAVRPTDANEQYDAIFKAIGGSDLGTRPKYWRAWDDAARHEVRATARPLEELRRRYPDRGPDLDAAVRRTDRAEEALRYLPVLTRHGDWVALIDSASGNVVGFAPFNAY